MGRHRSGGGAKRWFLPGLGILVASGLVVAGALTVLDNDPAGAPADIARLSCDRTLHVVTATSFAPVLDAVAAELGQGDKCVQLDVTVADGRAAIKTVADLQADAWIPDDSAWAGSAGSLALAQAPTANAGAVLATSPFYLVADAATGARLEQAGGGWAGVARLVAEQQDVRLVERDPAGSGDGLIAAAAPAEAVWLDRDMDASALWLSGARAKTRTVAAPAVALPTRPGEIGVVPEYALVPALAGAAGKLTALPGTDHTALLRYTWLPLLSAITDPPRAAALDRLYKLLTGSGAAAYLRSAGLRTPNATQPPAGSGGLPQPAAEPFGVLEPHHIDHVFATWYAADRRTNLLVVVDASGSMGAAAPGSKSSRMSLVRQGSRSLGGLLPDDSRMGLWEFGSKLDGDRDYKSLLGIAPLDKGHRRALGGAIDKLAAQQTGTGLYDTILAAYTSARNAYRPGVPNQVLIFTDGRNESDPGSLSAGALAAALGKAADAKRPVLLSVVTFGTPGDAKAVESATKPVGGYVDVLSSADEVAAVFIHVAAGGLHH